MVPNRRLRHWNGQPMLDITVPDEVTSITVHGNSAWDHGYVVQGGMDPNVIQPSNSIYYNNLGPPLALSLYETGLGSPPGTLGQNLSNDNSFEQNSTTSPNIPNLEFWNPVRAIQENVTPSQENKRQRISGPNGSMSYNLGQTPFELGSHVNVHPVSDSGYATSATVTSISATATAIVSPFPVDQTAYPPAMDLTWNTPQGYPPLQNQYAFGSEQQQQQPSGQCSVEEIRSQVNEFPCDAPGCNWSGKRQSDKKKHMIRHKKGFKCKQPGCPRKGGFGTINDLERHQVTVHKIKPTHRNRREFKCFGTNCTTKDKIWPRLDNFQQHLRRIHKDENTKELVQRSNIWYVSVKQSELNRSGGQSSSTGSVQQALVDPKSYRSNPLQETTQLNNRQLHPYEATSMDNRTPRNSSHYPHGIQLDEQEHLSGNTLNCATNSMSVEAATEDLSGSSREDQDGWDDIALQQNVDQPSEHNDGDRPSSSLLPENKQEPYFDPFTEAVRGLFEAMGKDLPNLRSEQLRDGNGAGLCEALDAGASDSPSETLGGSGMEAYLEVIKNGSKQSRDRARELLKATLNYLETSQVDTEVASPGNTDLTSKDGPLRRREKKVFTCRHDGCTRTTGRMSEMKKHEKRHSRPYGCTQPGCHKSFGSKNDWKRHENTQHFQLQRWRCPVKTSPTNHVAIRDETLLEGPDRKDFPPAFLDRTQTECARVFDRKDKFQQHLQSEHSLDEKAAKHTVKRNEIGRNGQFQFWCGFCRKLIRLRKEGQDAWDERFDHIDNEHYKQKQTIETWVHLEGHFTKECEEKGEKAGDMLETSDGLEVVGDVGQKSKGSDGGEEEPTRGMKSAVPTTSAAESILTPFAIPIRGHTRLSPAPGALSRAAPAVARQVSLAPATKRKYASTTANSRPGNNTVAHRASSFNSASMMPARQQQILSQQTIAFGGRGIGYSTAVNPFVPNYVYADVNGLIPVDNTVPQRAIISCCKCPSGTSEYMFEIAARCIQCDHFPCDNCKITV